MYRIETMDYDIEDGYPEYTRDVSEMEYAFAAVLDAQSEHGIPEHRLTVTRYLSDTEAEDGRYIDWSLNAEEFMADNTEAVQSMIKRLHNQKSHPTEKRG